MLEVYEETHVFIPGNITKDMVDSVTRKLSGDAEPVSMDLEALQGWLLILGITEKLCIGMEYFVEWIDIRIPPWSAYQAFMSNHLFVLYKLPVLCLVGVG